MTVNLEWDVAHAIVSPYGTLPLNAPGPVLSSGLYPVFLIEPPYTIVPTMRVTRDNISQTDGSSVQPPYLTGLVATLTVQYWVQPFGAGASEREAACAQDLREMDERLTLHLNALRVCSTDPATMQQLLWTPTGLGGDRMLTWVFLTSWLAPDYTNSPLVQTTFELASPYPYAVDGVAASTAIADGASAAIANAGSAGDKPVITVGPGTAFTITNTATGETVVYDSARPGAVAIGGGDSATIDFFLGSITLDSDGSDLVAGLDPTQTDFFSIAPGGATVATTGAGITVYSHNPVV
jgi:hypothetical protein